MGKAVSIIIRTKNEERWIGACLDAVFSQEFKDFEVIVVDNNSTDRTVGKVRQFRGVEILNIEDFLPGKAINHGIRASTGKYIVCLSGHCIPVDGVWLSRLVKSIQARGVAGVYGRQQPLSYSSDFDKRDLLITFGLDRKVQKKDSFFHNANSIIRRSVWKKIPFDEEITNIEDRAWAGDVIRQGYKIVYEPDASVYHYHGIHQNADSERCQKIVQILERLDPASLRTSVDPAKLSVLGIVPVKGKAPTLGGRPLLEYTMARIRQSRISHTVVIAEDDETLAEAAELGFEYCLKKPAELTRDFIDIQDILKYCLDQLEELGVNTDVAFYLSVNCPFRKRNFIDSSIDHLVNGGYDSVFPTIEEFRSCWIGEGGSMKRIDEGFMPSNVKQPLRIGIAGLGTATYGDVIRHGERLGKKIGMLELKDICQTIDVGKAGGHELAELIIKTWWAKNS